MEHAVNARWTLQLRIWAVRIRQRLGWAGLAGIALLAGSTIWGVIAWQAHRAPLPEESVSVSSTSSNDAPRSAAAAAAAAAVLELPRQADVALLLTQIQQTVVGQGLAWTTADYKLLPATDIAPAALEVRCNLKGSYPKVRAAIAQLLHGVPGLTIRDLSLSRINIDVADVDAKLTWVVFLQDEPSAAAESASSGSKP